MNSLIKKVYLIILPWPTKTAKERYESLMLSLIETSRLHNIVEYMKNDLIAAVQNKAGNMHILKKAQIDPYSSFKVAASKLTAQAFKTRIWTN